MQSLCFKINFSLKAVLHQWKLFIHGIILVMALNARNRRLFIYLHLIHLLLLPSVINHHNYMATYQLLKSTSRFFSEHTLKKIIITFQIHKSWEITKIRSDQPQRLTMFIFFSGIKQCDNITLLVQTNQHDAVIKSVMIICVSPSSLTVWTQPFVCCTIHFHSLLASLYACLFAFVFTY